MMNGSVVAGTIHQRDRHTDRQPRRHGKCRASAPRRMASNEKPVGFPSMNNVLVCDAVIQRLIIKEVKHILDGARQDVVTASHAKYCLE